MTWRGHPSIFFLVHLSIGEIVILMTCTIPIAINCLTSTTAIEARAINIVCVITHSWIYFCRLQLPDLAVNNYGIQKGWSSLLPHLIAWLWKNLLKEWNSNYSTIQCTVVHKMGVSCFYPPLV